MTALVGEISKDDMFIRAIAIDSDPTPGELACRGDALRVVVSTDTVERIKRAKQEISLPQLRRRFGGESLSAADLEQVVTYKNEVLNLACVQAGESLEFGCEVAMFAIYRWNLSGGDVSWLIQDLERKRVGTGAMIRGWAEKAGKRKQATRNSLGFRPGSAM